ncbi:alpha-ketoglutarate-dependent dioxygenase AlkB [Nodularia sp. NIES-3585]|uniref:alpha-ketoglutarate-dependent dioxygenase AlkB n=1 Tax=Nodularia sp. NIES-3585 TaxID=1973477 RepID=UPI000B5C2413|nr:alpha-ketoglutarate-dependent dioxygenase AlkB [Nodularia sp. NIES-3585]GAX34337.1 2OG-Fe(II) oxygenase [Nodularia sp. NIES-3585]
MNKKKNKSPYTKDNKKSLSQKEYTQLELFSEKIPEKNTYSRVDFDEISKLKQKLQAPKKSDQNSLNQQTIPQISGKALHKVEITSFFHDTRKENSYTDFKVHEVKGLKYIPEFITQSEHNYLIKQVDNQPWLSDLKRRVQHYGYKYNYKARAIDTSMHIGALPDWALDLAYKLYNANFIDSIPDQVIVNEYLPGQGISSHIDCVPCFSDTIISLSLGSACIMDFTNPSTDEKIPVLLEPKSIVLLKEDARYKWTHSIAARKTDKFQEKVITRERRISLTFRKVILANP